MNPIAHVLQALRRSDAFEAMVQDLESAKGSALQTASGSMPSLCLRALSEQLQFGSVVVVVPDLRRGHDLVADWECLDAGEGITPVLLPPLDADPYSGVSAHPDTLRSRVEALSRLAHASLAGDSVFLVLPARALRVPLPPPELFLSWMLHLHTEREYDISQLREDLTSRGYLREDTVASRGEFASRGYILDLFPVDRQVPLRLEFFGDTLTTIRAFDPATQRSLEEEFDRLVLPPMREFSVGDETPRKWATDVTDGDAAAVASWAEMLQREGSFAGYELLHWTEDKTRSRFEEHVPDATWVVMEPEACRAELVNMETSLLGSYESRTELSFPPPDRFLFSLESSTNRLDSAILHLNPLGKPEDRPLHRLDASPIARYEGNLDRFQQDAAEVLEGGGSVTILLETPGTLARFEELLSEVGLAKGRLYVEGRPDDGLPADLTGWVLLGRGRLRSGFRWESGPTLVVTDRDLHVGRSAPKKRRGAPAMEAFLSSLQDLKEGDLVVHADHGIAVYRGIRTMPGPAGARDFLILEYHGGDKLYQPLERLDAIQKYSGVAGVAPRKDKLGGGSWRRVKSRVRSELQDMTKELLTLYSKRMAARGHAFSPDQPWQREFEDSFPYEETPDQTQAILDTKADMESYRPMDRLVVGDVGFGKTEVAMRAAMKAVLDGKQVAILAPTTVLTFQHHHTLSSRFADYPMRIDLLSRFRGAKEQKETVRGLADGSVDIVVGTHRLLGKDVIFKDLGLLIVDEEQRFGVRHKERLKEIRANVDVLTLTATPIPRTLQMSMAGLRDMSLIRTPPAGRYAIQTEVVPFRQETLKLALRRELERGGQIYFVHNRVSSIHSMADLVKELVPEAKILVAHGQMGERELEETILDFVAGKADILVTTTIIENGVDIPRVNTIVVNRADHFGLSQLYQLRGRVGRSDQRAYAYLIVPSLDGMSDVARKRLLALKEFTQLGSGFRLAAMDLEIRGAGNLLGAQQSGHIAALGFEMYCRLLEQTAAELRGEEVVETIDAKIALPLDLHLPETYVPEQGERLAVYKRVVSARDPAELERVTEEVVDRYGHAPVALENLVCVAKLRLLASKLLVEAVETAGKRLLVRFPEETRADLGELVAMLQEFPGATLSPRGVLEIPLGARDPGELALAILSRLE